MDQKVKPGMLNSTSDLAVGAQHHNGRAPNNIYTRLLNKLYRLIGEPPIKIALWNGAFVGSKQTAVATVNIHNSSALFKLVLHPDLYFGELYTNGTIHIDGDLVKLLAIIFQSQQQAKPLGLMHRGVQDYLSRPQKNTLENSKSNIHRHYNIGNEFYQLWLDENMQYTCAYYRSIDNSLEQAQLNKMEHICRKLQLRPGQTVVEAGCGWGSFALYMAKHYDVKVKSYNISKEQIKYARERIKSIGLEHKVEYVLDDYRNVQGQYDAFVSVGMLEHVGTEYYLQLGEIMQRCLKDDGTALLHFIGRNSPMPMNAWIEKRIFPGAHPPALSEVLPLFENCGFSVLDIENIRLHYSKTLREWLNRYEDNIQQVIDRFDQDFARSWRLYLAGSIAAFNTGDLQLFQIVANKADNNNISLTREHIYSTPASQFTWNDTTL